MKMFWMTLGAVLLLAANGRAATNEIMISSGNASSAASTTITLPTGSSTTYRVVFGVVKDGTTGIISLITNGDTTGTWARSQFGFDANGHYTFGGTQTGGCPFANLFSSSVLQGQFIFTTKWANIKVGTLYGINVVSNGASNSGGTTGNLYGSGECYGPAETATISSIAFRASAGNMSSLHWELWQGVTHSP